MRPCDRTCRFATRSPSGLRTAAAPRCRIACSRAGTPPEGTPTEPAGDVIALYSDFDAWLQPVDDAYCPGGFNIAVSGIGHCAMLLSRRVADLIVENLTAPMPGDV